MWNEKESPLRIEKRFDFDQYSKISKFMEEIEKFFSLSDISLLSKNIERLTKFLPKLIFG